MRTLAATVLASVVVHWGQAPRGRGWTGTIPAGRGGGSGRRSRRCCPPARWLGRTPRATADCGPAGAAGRRGPRGRRGGRVGGARGVGVIAGQPLLETVDGRQRHLRAVKFGDRDGPVEGDDRRG